MVYKYFDKLICDDGVSAPGEIKAWVSVHGEAFLHRRPIFKFGNLKTVVINPEVCIDPGDIRLDCKHLKTGRRFLIRISQYLKVARDEFSLKKFVVAFGSMNASERDTKYIEYFSDYAWRQLSEADDLSDTQSQKRKLEDWIRENFGLEALIYINLQSIAETSMEEVIKYYRVQNIDEVLERIEQSKIETDKRQYLLQRKRALEQILIKLYAKEGFDPGAEYHKALQTEWANVSKQLGQDGGNNLHSSPPVFSETKGYEPELSPSITRSDIVDCSVFAPPLAAPNAPFAIHAVLHLRAELVKAAKLVSQVDPAANRLQSKRLNMQLQPGSTVDLFLDCQALRIERPLQSVVWEGDPIRTSFVVYVANGLATRFIKPVLHLCVNGVPLGEIEFRLEVSDEYPKAESQSSGSASELIPQVPIRTTEYRYTNCFVSYSRKDFTIVSFFAQGLSESGVKPCIDVTELEPGDEWEGCLPEFVRRADVVYVMWSANAAASKWVDFETRLACELKSRSGRPAIKPIPLCQPWPKPPDHLAKFHFYSEWQAHRISNAVGLVSCTEDQEPKT